MGIRPGALCITHTDSRKNRNTRFQEISNPGLDFFGRFIFSVGPDFLFPLGTQILKAALQPLSKDKPLFQFSPLLFFD
jgi:hypothetical protein